MTLKILLDFQNQILLEISRQISKISSENSCGKSSKSYSRNFSRNSHGSSTDHFRDSSKTFSKSSRASVGIPSGILFVISTEFLLRSLSASEMSSVIHLVTVFTKFFKHSHRNSPRKLLQKFLVIFFQEFTHGTPSCNFNINSFKDSLGNFVKHSNIILHGNSCSSYCRKYSGNFSRIDYGTGRTSLEYP